MFHVVWMGAFSFVPSQIWRSSALLYCYAASRMRRAIREAGQCQDFVNRFGTQEYGGGMKNKTFFITLYLTNTKYHISINFNLKVWYLWYTIDMTIAQHVIIKFTIGCIWDYVDLLMEPHDSRMVDVCFRCGWRWKPKTTGIILKHWITFGRDS